MLIDQVFFYFLVGVGIMLSLPALWLLMGARWPERVEKLRHVSGRSVAMSFIAGLLPLLLVIGLLSKAVQYGKKMDLIPLFVLAFFSTLIFVWALAGLAGLARMIGEKLSASNTEPWKATLRGGVILVCLLSMPYIGWFALLPVSIIVGGGMMLRSFFVKSDAAAPTA